MLIRVHYKYIVTIKFHNNLSSNFSSLKFNNNINVRNGGFNIFIFES